MADDPGRLAAKADKPPNERIAVVFAHGQGEQIPMQDVTELARTVWTTDVDSKDDPGFKSQVWSVPVYDADMSEQRRLVTDALQRGSDRPLQVDFYQFYWADLMTGNRFIQLWRWFGSLMRRKEDTPEPLLRIRRVVMWAGFGVGLFGFLFGVVTAARLTVLDPRFDWDAWQTWGRLLPWANVYVVALVLSLIPQAWWLARPSLRMQAFVGGLGLTIISLLLGLADEALVMRHNHMPATSSYEILGVDGTHLVSSIHGVMGSSVVLFVALALWRIWRLYDSFLVPVMADSARMLSATPENVPARDAIRKRGMELLEALHNSERRYERIVFVAHSLGTVVAYNVLAQYWGNVYRQLNHDATKAERRRVEDMANALNEAGRATPGPEGRRARAVSRRDYRKAVRAYFAALRTRPLPPDNDAWLNSEFTTPGQLMRNVLAAMRGQKTGVGFEPRPQWLISDFITLGSPLTYGRLLMTKNGDEFESAFNTRRFTECPPTMDPKDGMVHAGRPHHAAVFAACCWTNIYFESEGALKGDIIGGPVAGPVTDGRFGWGPLDVAVKREVGMPQFAHNEYWKWRETPDGREAEHVLALRAALRLRGDVEAYEDQLIRLAPPRGWPEEPADEEPPPPKAASRRRRVEA